MSSFSHQVFLANQHHCRLSHLIYFLICRRLLPVDLAIMKTLGLEANQGSRSHFGTNYCFIINAILCHHSVITMIVDSRCCPLGRLIHTYRDFDVGAPQQACSLMPASFERKSPTFGQEVLHHPSTLPTSWPGSAPLHRP